MQSAGFRLAGVLTSCGRGLPEQPGAMEAAWCGDGVCRAGGWRHGGLGRRRQRSLACGMRFDASIQAWWAPPVARRHRLQAAARCRLAARRRTRLAGAPIVAGAMRATAGCSSTLRHRCCSSSIGSWWEQCPGEHEADVHVAVCHSGSQRLTASAPGLRNQPACWRDGMSAIYRVETAVSKESSSVHTHTGQAGQPKSGAGGSTTLR